jgi:putative oxidoreductase
MEPVNIALWILQLLLAVAFIAHGWMLVSPPPELLPIINEQLGVGFRLFIGVAEIAGSIGLILPALARVRPGLTPVAAASLGFVVACATVLHVSRGEISSAVTTAILFTLCALVAYGRWRVRPIEPRGAQAQAVAA